MVEVEIATVWVAEGEEACGVAAADAWCWADWQPGTADRCDSGLNQHGEVIEPEAAPPGLGVGQDGLRAGLPLVLPTTP